MLLMVFQQSHYHLRQQGPSSIMLLLRRRPYVASTSEAMADTAADGVDGCVASPRERPLLPPHRNHQFRHQRQQTALVLSFEAC